MFRGFVLNFTRIASPPTKKLRKGDLTTLDRIDKDENKAFESLKKELVDPPVMDLPRLKGHYTIETDACDKKIG